MGKRGALTSKPSEASRSHLLAKLKPGPGQLPEEVRASQQARIRHAMVELVAERGYSGVTIRGLVRTSGVSTSTFYRHFPNVEECFASTYRAIMLRAFKHLSDETESSRDWEKGLRKGIRTLTLAVARNPHAARLALVDCYDGGPAMLREVETATSTIERRLVEGEVPLPTRLGQGAVAGVERVIRTKLLEGLEQQLPETAEELADWVLSLYDLEPEPRLGLKLEGDGPRPLALRKDPAFAVFDAIGGDRGRILAAVAKLSAAGGYWNLTLPSVRREAGVSRRNFNAIFAGVDACYLEAVEVLARAAVRTAAKESSASTGRPGRVEPFAISLCEQIARSPLMARLGFIDVFAPGGAGLRCRERLVTEAAQMLLAARRDPVVSGSAAEATASAGWRLLQAELQEATGSAPSQESAALLTQLPLPLWPGDPQTRPFAEAAISPFRSPTKSARSRNRKHCT